MPFSALIPTPTTRTIISKQQLHQGQGRRRVRRDAEQGARVRDGEEEAEAVGEGEGG